MKEEPKINLTHGVDLDLFLQTALDWWKTKLFLDRWIIHTKVCNFHDEPLGDNLGYCDADYVNQVAVIYLADHDTIPEGSAMTICDEHTLVHELLHLKYPVTTDHTYSGEMIARHTHATLEEMAKTLLMVKYDLPFSWFDSNTTTR